MKVIVTGAAGFIGSAVCRELLRNGSDVIGIDNYNPHYSVEIKKSNISSLSKDPGFKFISSNIEEKEGLIRIIRNSEADNIVHMAAEVGSRISAFRPNAYYRVNVLGTQNVLDAALLSGIKKVVIASSSTVYHGETKCILNEDLSEISPSTPYAVSKRINELMGEITTRNNKISVIALRIFSAYGPGQRPDLAIHRFVERIVSGKELELLTGNNNVRDYVYVEDIAKSVLSSLEKLEGYKVVNIGSGEGISLNKLVGLIENTIGERAKIRLIESPVGDKNIGVADISLAKKILGYEPVTDIHSGIVKFYEWFKKNRRN